MYMCVCMSNADNLLTKRGNVSFSRRALLHGVSSYICSLSDSDLANRPALLTFFLIFVIMSKRIPWSSPIARRSKFLSDCHSWTFSQKCESYMTYVFETASLKWRKTLYFHINNCKVIFPFTAYAFCIGGLLLTEPRENSPCGCVGFEEIPFRCEVTTPQRFAAPWGTAALCRFSYTTLYRLVKRKPHKRDVWNWNVRFVMVTWIFILSSFMIDTLGLHNITLETHVWWSSKFGYLVV
jgi:hypothetical protein